MTQRRRLPPDVRRAQLADAVLAVASSGRTLESLSGAEIARAAGMAEGSLYRHYGSLRALLVAVLERTTSTYRDRLETLERDDPLAAFALALSAYLDCVEAEPVAWRLVLTPHVDAELERVYDDLTVLMTGMVGEVLGVDPLPASLDVLLRGWLDLERTVCRRWLDDDRLDRATVESVLTGALLGGLQACVAREPDLERLFDGTIE